MTDTVLPYTQSNTAELLEACDEGPASGEFVRDLVSKVGDKWSILTLSTLARGSLRFTELQHAIPGISHRMLSVTLQSLVRDGLVERESFGEVPPRVEYSLAPLGETLLGPIRALVVWANEHSADVESTRSSDANRTA
ncbi:helix-turn-helix transcriptional regulator [Herbiconiux sp. CPCC 205763]|uniref:Helix-turn-helix transcriptional regulator n=1 Tax=Herbiconiux aconitum TaxID=2970913 RepID=A0ABT2GTQ6_9MICO|nr:helix-turn-helix domain-containing protein [Herbiconiux aconitum]MCS5719606.1 helix-turn-helix transcriptional regulator [Herbiconiux aconitum]